VTLPDVFMVVGFLLGVAGVALWSVPAAMVVAGVVLFVSGGVASTRKGTTKS
jgi:cytochrome c-type biogenesis protein CcmH/NrfF